MAKGKDKTLIFRPVGLSDAVDASDAGAGAMAVLQNLIPDPSTADVWVPRPASVVSTAFSGFTSPGFVSVFKIVGNIAYGMIASGLHAGYDQPFAYNLLTQAFLTVNGITAANVPASPATTGDWTPPSIDVIGTRIVVCHPGFPGGTVKFGWFDTSSFSAAISCTTNGTTTLTSATNLLQAGVQPGQTVAKSDVPAGTTIVSIASNGLSAVLSASATGSSSSSTTFAGGTPTAPLWGAGDCNINNLPSVPVSVAQFNGRAYFACSNSVYWSDSLLACNRTNATQGNTFGNGLAVTALAGLPLTSQVQGGVIQAVICFQGTQAMQQITGDSSIPAGTTGCLNVNQLNAATGTNAPRTIVPTNLGLAFISPEGLRIIDFAAVVSDPIGAAGEGVAVPFIFSSYQTRMCAAANADVIRITTQNGFLSSAPTYEYWFHVKRKCWSGPHTFPMSCLQPWGQTFIGAPVGVTASLYQSDCRQSSTSTFTENGTALTWSYQPCLLPDAGDGTTFFLKEASVNIAMPYGQMVAVSCSDDTGAVMDSVTISQGGQASVWGGFNWGGALWGAAISNPYQRRVSWVNTNVAKQFTITLAGYSATGTRVGNAYIEYVPIDTFLER